MARTEALLDAAQGLLLTRGPAGLTMAAVADEAGVAVGGLYRYFAGKDAILSALQVRAVHAFSQVLRKAIATTDAPLDGVRAAAAAWPAFAESEPELFALLDRSLSDPQPNLDDEAAAAVDGAVTQVLGQVTTLLEDAEQRGQLTAGDAQLRTHAVWAAVHGAAHFRKRQRLGGPSADEVLHTAVDGLLAGWATLSAS